MMTGHTNKRYCMNECSMAKKIRFGPKNLRGIQHMLIAIALTIRREHISKNKSFYHRRCVDENIRIRGSAVSQFRPAQDRISHRMTTFLNAIQSHEI